MSNFYIFTFLLLTLTSCNKNCKSVSEGTFRIESQVGNYTIVRSKNKQTEKVESTGVVSEYKIKWTSDCSYILFDRKVIKGVDILHTKDTLYCTIIAVTGKEHKVRSYFKGHESAEFTLVKVTR